ncbi:hypothetical protein ALC53_14098 [Atta colombica]|uniref:Uncharacterized protein n=1 Tax=Atta colombica TaxID=520822 RepID=A0A195ATL7_9HYME|nr:hypothetical protein ALC53_14098 [Atta colombica]
MAAAASNPKLLYVNIALVLYNVAFLLSAPTFSERENSTAYTNFPPETTLRLATTELTPRMHYQDSVCPCSIDSSDSGIQSICQDPTSESADSALSDTSFISGTTITTARTCVHHYKIDRRFGRTTDLRIYII